MIRGFADEVRDELAHLPLGRSCCQRAEASALLRLGGALELRGGDDAFGHTFVTGSAAIARRLRAVLDARYGLRPQIEVHRAGSLRPRGAYRLRLQPPVTEALTDLGLLDAARRPREGIDPGSSTCDRGAYVRGALMAAGSLSAPAGDPHLEIRAPGEGTARALGAVVEQIAEAHAGIAMRSDGWRVTVKSSSGIATLLARTGAHAAFLRWDQERLRRELRREANRDANADRANLGRAVAAASHQVEAISWLLGSALWADLDDELRAVALARLANPEASLAELGGLVDPAVGKATVHRRLGRLVDLARAATAADHRPEPGPERGRGPRREVR